MIDASSSEQLSESGEQLRHLLRRNTHSSVLHFNREQILRPTAIQHLQIDKALLGEFKRVSDQVHQNLLYPSFIADESGHFRKLINRYHLLPDLNSLNSSLEFDTFLLRLRTKYHRYQLHDA